MTDSFITLEDGTKVATVTESIGGNTVHFEKDVSFPANSVGYIALGVTLAEIPTSFTEVTALTIALDKIAVFNENAAAVNVQVKNTAGKFLLDTDIPPKSLYPIDFGCIPVVGLQWKAASAGVNGAVLAYRSS